MKATAYNVAALDKVLGLATKVGDSYKPGNASIERTALTSLLEESRKSITAVLEAEGNLTTAINTRQQAFDLLTTLGMRIRDVAEGGGMDEKSLQDLDRMRKRFRSQPSKPALNTIPGGQNNNTTVSVPSAETPVRKNRTLSYDSKVVTLEQIITFLGQLPNYNPTTPELTIPALKERLAELQALNTAVIDAKSTLTKARAESNQMVFDRKTGIYGRAKMTKRYLRSLLGNRAELYRSISKVKFKMK